MITLSVQDKEGFATIVSGVVKLLRSMADGRQQIVALQFSGHCVGSPIGTGQTVVAVAATDVELCCVDQQRIDMLMSEHPQMMRMLLQGTLSALNASRDWMLLLGRKTADERVASLFLMLAEREINAGCMPAPAGPVHFSLPISRTDIADFLGLTIETVSRQIQRLKKLGILVFDGQRNVSVPAMAALRHQAEQEQT
jgi:CRP/FNR family transcriptional regulator